MTRVGINGFGRIGRLTYRTIRQYHAKDLQVVAVNDLTDTKTNAHLLKWDSAYGRYPGEIEVRDDGMIVDGQEVKTFAQRDPKLIPWGKLGVDVVLESTGVLTDAKLARSHIDGGAKKVVISAPAKNEDITLVLGVNEKEYDSAKHNIISNASCTTNCVAQMIKIMHDNFGITQGFMNTVHSYTNDQRLQDLYHKDLRRARAAAQNIIPTSTGAASLVGLIIKDLNGKLDGISLRVPTLTVSVADLTVNVKKPVTIESINAAFRTAANGRLKGILEYTEEELVSMDFKGNPASCIFDAPSTMVIGNMVKILGWYDNEWGYSSRLADMAAYVTR